MERLRSLARADEKEWYRTLHEGYEMAGNEKEAAWAEKQFLRRFAYTDDAFDWVREKWMNEHPYPGDPRSPEAKVYFHDLYGESTKWVRAWPQSALAKFDRLFAAGNIDQLPDREVLAAIDDFLRGQLEDPDGIRGVPPLEFSVARIYLDRGIRVNRIPVLIDETLREEEARIEKESDEGSEARRQDERNLEQTRFASWPLLAEAYLKLGRLEESKKVVARMEQALSEAASKKAASPAGARPAMKETKRSGAEEESDADRALAEALKRGQLYHMKGRIAELEKHPADAWTYYRAGLLIMPAAVQDSRDRLESDARQLWKKLGGTEEGWRIALEKSTSEIQGSIGEASGWQEKHLPLPEFELIDLAGRRWTRAELKGKVSFINIWATWCGPCQGELPHLQKLHEKLRGRSDVQLLTFNIDGNPGVVEPFMKKQGYTFPALPAGPYVTRFVGSVGIPRNWIVNREGTLISEQVGYGSQGDQQWIEQIMAQIDKAIASP
ncbi:MAG TPA: TlpA disulfide reductase family protein [Candidatus Polarisedimenticolia bacterium]|nr:TlpA disulfide reductase family protein [Candidatus Polarisedimenticolia bacterium]